MNNSNPSIHSPSGLGLKTLFTLYFSLPSLSCPLPSPKPDHPHDFHLCLIMTAPPPHAVYLNPPLLLSWPTRSFLVSNVVLGYYGLHYSCLVYQPDILSHLFQICWPVLSAFWWEVFS